MTASSFVLPPIPGNETKLPERNFHPRLIMKRISLITLVDCGHCSASFSKKKKKKGAESISMHCFYCEPGRV